MNELVELLYIVLESEGHLIDDVGVVGAAFIVHAPAAIDELELAVSHEIPYNILSIFILLIPPSLEERNFGVNEPVRSNKKYGTVQNGIQMFYELDGLLARWIEKELIDDAVDDLGDADIMN